MNLLRLAAMLDIPAFHSQAERILRVFAERLDRVPIAVPELTSALMFYHNTPTQVLTELQKLISYIKTFRVFFFQQNKNDKIPCVQYVIFFFPQIFAIHAC